MERRKFLQYSLAGLATFTLPLSYLNASVDSEIGNLNSTFLEFISDKKEVLEVGKKYLRLHPHEGNAQFLRKLLLESKIQPDLGISPLEKQVQKDFQEGHIVTINGWVLSKTEARHCAYYSIIHS